MNGRQILNTALEIDTKFQGVFARNEIPQTKTCLIFNNQPRGLPGEHWMAIYDDQYFCSYGSKSPFNTHKETFSTAVQSPASSTCGQHSLYFIFCMKNGIAHKYSSNTYQNDKMVVKWLKRNYNLSTDVFDVDFVLSQIATAFVSQFR